MDIVSARPAVDDFRWPTLTTWQMASLFKLSFHEFFNRPMPWQSVVRHVESNSQFDIIRKNHHLSDPSKQSRQTRNLAEGSTSPLGR
ncbi:hypothetical protein F3P66_19175 [Agrobacterium fabrum]|uniref:Uncharacterized protein n=1 Tax=Agrobacterium fabrum (strain C58 / ATCC 33970) TaxID=176299 RepID=Q8U4X8_AGRFC|nr:hypothetical protein Atu3920 [Agrobacterium fabrum str. C58]QRM61532.1 hypothetical protein F3P66_19175 [Agrobacterium fabrum]TRB27421.1 hypothetical protein EXN51_19990 [Agrobacterium fabrum]